MTTESVPGTPESTLEAPGRTKPALADPDTRFDVDETGEVWDLGTESVGWDLSFGCRINFGHNQAMGKELQASVRMSDYPAQRGFEVRRVTEEQLSMLAHKILQMIGEELLADL